MDKVPESNPLPLTKRLMVKMWIVLSALMILFPPVTSWVNRSFQQERSFVSEFVCDLFCDRSIIFSLRSVHQINADRLFLQLLGTAAIAGLAIFLIGNSEIHLAASPVKKQGKQETITTPPNDQNGGQTETTNLQKLGRYHRWLQWTLFWGIVLQLSCSVIVEVALEVPINFWKENPSLFEIIEIVSTVGSLIIYPAFILYLFFFYKYLRCIKPTQVWVWLNLLGLLVPIIGYYILWKRVRYGTKILRENGIKVGFMGAKP